MQALGGKKMKPFILFLGTVFCLNFPTNAFANPNPDEDASSCGGGLSSTNSSQMVNFILQTDLGYEPTFSFIASMVSHLGNVVLDADYGVVMIDPKLHLYVLTGRGPMSEVNQIDSIQGLKVFSNSGVSLFGPGTGGSGGFGTFGMR